jgi:hypothetical protein
VRATALVERAFANNGNHRQAAHAWNTEAIDPIHATISEGNFQATISGFLWRRDGFEHRPFQES